MTPPNDTARELVERLRRKTIAGVTVFPTPLDLKAAELIEKQEREIEGLRKAGDVLAHCLLFKDHDIEMTDAELDALWALRGHDNCTVCNPDAAMREGKER